VHGANVIGNDKYMLYPHRTCFQLPKLINLLNRGEPSLGIHPSTKKTITTKNVIKKSGD